MTQIEFYKSFLFVVELLLAEFLFVYRFRRKPQFYLRLTLGVLATFVFAFLFPTPKAWADNAFYCSFLFLMIFGFTVFVCKFIYNENMLTILFCCLAGYTTQHFSYEIYNLLLVIMGVSETNGFYGELDFLQIFPNPFFFVTYVCIYVLSYCVSYFIFSDKLNESDEIDIEKNFIFIFAIFILIIDIFLNAIVVYNPTDEGAVSTVVVGVYNILCCFISLYLQFEVALRRRVEKEFDAMQEMWTQAKKQYAMSKENIELINMKCHDLKHQIHTLRKNQTVSPTVLKELEDNISIYDSTIKTGNDALDIILTEKSLLCNKENIQFSCIVDGQKLNFMKNEDIYAMFGNIVDNAIEAVLKVEPSKRTISLRGRVVDNMVVINASNYYADEIIYKDGQIQTSKEEKVYHGFGLRSIQYICQRYGGEATFTAENHIFTVNLLFFLDADRNAR